MILFGMIFFCECFLDTFVAFNFVIFLLLFRSIHFCYIFSIAEDQTQGGYR